MGMYAFKDAVGYAECFVLLQTEIKRSEAERSSFWRKLSQLPAGRTGRSGPAAKHLIDSPCPLCRTRRGELLYASGSRSLASPHDWFGSKKPCVFGDQVSVGGVQLINAQL